MDDDTRHAPWEDALLDLADRFGLQQFVFVCRDNAALRVRACGNSPADQAGAKMLAEACMEAINRNQDKIIDAMLEATP